MFIGSLDKLSEIFATRDVTVDDLIHALQPTDDEVQLIQLDNVTIHCGLMHGSGGSPCVILEGCATGRCPPSLRKLFLLIMALLQSSGDVIMKVMAFVVVHLRHTWLFVYLSTLPYLADNVAVFGLVEVKCPLKHRKNNF